MIDLPYMELDEVGALLGYKNLRASKRAIKEGRFDIPTYILNGRNVANVAVVRKYFQDKTDEGVLALELEEAS